MTIQELLIHVESAVVHGRLSCDRGCGGRARFSTNVGVVCSACRNRLDHEANANLAALRELVSAYPLEVIGPEYALESLVNSLAPFGLIRLRPSSNPTCSQLVYCPNPRAAVRTYEGDRGTLNRQMQAVARILWGLFLLAGADLTEWPRDAGYPPAEIRPYQEVILWARDSRSRVVWLLDYAAAMQVAWTSWPRTRKGKAVPAPQEPHKSLDGVIAHCGQLLRQPGVQGAIPVRLHDGDDWPPVKSHPTVRSFGSAA